MMMKMFMMTMMTMMMISSAHGGQGVRPRDGKSDTTERAGGPTQCRNFNLDHLLRKAITPSQSWSSHPAATLGICFNIPQQHTFCPLAISIVQHLFKKTVFQFFVLRCQIFNAS
eukprot:12191367-Karenia_brevis.AAC.1